MAKEDNFRIKPSTITNVGLGLYSYKNPFNCNQHIEYYTGRFTTALRLAKKYKNKTAPFAMCANNSNSADCIDATRSTDEALQYANDAKCKRLTNIMLYPQKK